MISTRNILLALIDELQRNNSGSITVSALAKAAGISRSSIYKYYPDILNLIQLNRVATPSSAETNNIKKLALMRGQLEKSKELVSYLANICTNQLVEISELNERLENLERNSSNRITYLESKLTRLQKKPLRTVK